MKSQMLNKSKVSNINENNERMCRLSDRLCKIALNMETEKSGKYDNYENKILNLYNSIEETKENSNKKFNELKDQILVIQKNLDDESTKREAGHNDFMDFIKKMEEKVFEKFDHEFSAKKEIELKIVHYLEEKFNSVKSELQRESKVRYDSIENLEFYFENELPKIQDILKQNQVEREDNDEGHLKKMNDETQKINNMIENEKRSREETQEGILEMIKIMNDRMKNDLSTEVKEREQNEEILIELLEGTCGNLQNCNTK